MTTKTVILKNATTKDVVSALTSRLDQISVRFPMLVDLHDLSLNGIQLTQQEVIVLIQNIVESVDYSVVRGSITSEIGTVSYSDQKYFAYERIDNSISSNDLNIRVKCFQSYTFYVSENNWIDIHFIKPDGTVFTMVIVP